MSADSPAAAYFSAVWKNLLALTFHDQLPKEAWPTGDSRWWVVVENMLDADRTTASGTTCTPARSSRPRDDILRTALENARDELTRIRSSNPEQWRWGDLHQLTLATRPSAPGRSPVAFMFNRGPYDVPGGSSVVDATSFDASRGLRRDQRAVDADDRPARRTWTRLAGCDLTGESGHAYDPTTPTRPSFGSRARRCRGHSAAAAVEPPRPRLSPCIPALHTSQ